MPQVKFIFWKEYECPKCGQKTLKRKIDGEVYLTQCPYWCEFCGYEEYRDVAENSND